MKTNRTPIVSAQAILRSASGKPTKGAAITSANIGEYLPALPEAERAAAMLRELGFEVGQLVGNSFSITGPASLFESAFKVRLRDGKKKGVVARGEGATEGSYELPLAVLPKQLKELLEAVTFTPPPDFGPGSW